MSAIRSFIGRRGQGKSTAMEHFARLDNPRRICWDPRLQFWHGEIARNAEELAALIDRESFPIVYRPGKDLQTEFGDFVAEILNFQNLSIEIDEASRLMSAQWINDSLDELIRASRHLEISLNCSTHRMQDTNGLYLDECTDYVLFRTKGKRSLEKIADYTSEEAAKIVAELDRRQFLHWNVDEDTFTVEKDSRSWFEPIGLPERSQHRGQAAAA